MSDDLLERARFVVQLFRECDAIQLPHGPTEQVLIGMIDRIEELEAKLAQQDDLVQAAVAAALREAAEGVGCLLPENGAAGATDYTDRLIDEVRREDVRVVLALITPDAQAALDRVVAAERDALAEKLKRAMYVLGGVRGAIKTGRNEPLMIWADQIDIAIAEMTETPHD